MSHRRLVGRGLASIGLLAVVAIAAAPASAVTKVVTEFKLKTANNQPGDMAVGTDGNVWFVDQNTGKVSQISKTGTITGYLTHTPNSRPTGITLGSDGAMWFTEAAADKIGRISGGGPATDYPIPTAASSPRGITLGTDGDLYFTEYAPHTINKIDPGTHAVTLVATLPSGSGPTHIASGPDGNLWVTETLSNAVARVTPGGTVTQVPLTANSAPSRIVAGPLNSLWVAEPGTNQVAQISTAGSVTQQISVAGKPTGIAVGADTSPALWVTEPGANKIARVTTTGTVTQYPIPTAGSLPGGIALGTDGNLWFSENAGDKIGRLTDTPGHSSYVVVHDFGYLPASQGIALKTGSAPGKPTTVRWLFEGPNAHSVTEDSGAGIFDSGSQEPGTQFAFTFITAGTFNYDDTIGSLTGGMIKVTPQAALNPAKTAIIVTMATSAPPAGTTTDVQVELPGGSTFTTVDSADTAATFAYTPTGGHGLYKFQVRTNKGGFSSGWSPTARITF
jgi:streptogramin lyase